MVLAAAVFFAPLPLLFSLASPFERQQPFGSFPYPLEHLQKVNLKLRSNIIKGIFWLPKYETSSPSESELLSFAGCLK